MRGTYRYTRLREVTALWHTGHTSTWAAQSPQNTCLQRVSKTTSSSGSRWDDKEVTKHDAPVHAPAVQRRVFGVRHANAAGGGVFDTGGGGGPGLRPGQLPPRARCAVLRVRHYLAVAAQVEIESKT